MSNRKLGEYVLFEYFSNYIIIHHDIIRANTSIRMSKLLYNTYFYSSITFYLAFHVCQMFMTHKTGYIVHELTTTTINSHGLCFALSQNDSRL